MTSGWRKRGYGRVKPMNTTQTQVRSTDEALSVFDTLKLAFEALKDNQHLVADNKRHMYVMEYNSIIEKCEEALAQQPQNEVRGLSHSNEQSKCNHTKTITRADIDGNQIETTCGECGERVAQQPQDVVRGLLSNEQVEPVAKVNFYTGKIEWLMPVSFDIPVTIDVPPMYLYTHPPVPYVVEPRTAQPQEPEQEPVAYVYERNGYDTSFSWSRWDKEGRLNWKETPFYTTPPQRKPLTDEGIDAAIKCAKKVDTGYAGWVRDQRREFARAIEAAHGIKE